MSSRKIRHITEASEDGTRMTPEQLLEILIDDIRNGKQASKYPKMIIIGLNDEGDNYHLQFWQAGMMMSEIISLAEVTKRLAMDEILSHENE